MMICQTPDGDNELPRHRDIYSLRHEICFPLSVLLSHPLSLSLSLFSPPLQNRFQACLNEIVQQEEREMEQVRSLRWKPLGVKAVTGFCGQERFLCYLCPYVPP